MSMQAPSRFAAVLFDLDGVLVDSRGPIAHCINHALQCEGLAPEPEEALYPFIGPPLEHSFEQLLAARGVSIRAAPRCVANYRERYTVIAPRDTPAMPGMADCLRSLPDRLTLAVATSKPEVFARPILEATGLARYFAAITGPPLAATAAENKTRTVERALAALSGAPAPARVAMVGDRHFDVQAGRAHGLFTIGVAWGIGDALELREAGVDRLVATPAELGVLLRGA